jgi:hypothetical protein
MQQAEEVELEVFRAGDYGPKGQYTEGDLQAMAEDYRPGLLEAPLTFDHAQTGPAFGWIAALRREGTRLVAVLRGVPQAVRHLVRSGAYKRCSIELVRNLPDTGRPYVRAISLLGAATPQVKGLAEIKFSDEAVTAFDDLPEENGGVGGKAVVDEVDVVDGRAPDATLDALGAIAEKQSGELESELGELRREIADLRRELRARSADAVFSELRGEGYMIPDEDVRALSQLATHFDGETVRFSESREMPVAEWLRNFVRGWAVRVPLGSAVAHPGLSGGPGCEAGLGNHPRTDPASLELHKRALALMKSGSASTYAQAVASAAR